MELGEVFYSVGYEGKYSLTDISKIKYSLTKTD
jgi:hypothetical protein